jgi:hypothetical protein
MSMQLRIARPIKTYVLVGPGGTSGNHFAKIISVQKQRPVAVLDILYGVNSR